MRNTAVKIAMVFAVIVSLTAMQRGNAVSCELVHVAIPKDKLAENDRVVAFTASIAAGGVLSLPSVPIGWSITIDNDPSWQTSIKGTVIVGAAALDTKSSPAFFDRFLTIEKEPCSAYSDAPLDVTVEIVTTTDFVNLKTLVLKKSDLKLDSEVTGAARCLGSTDEERCPPYGR